ncbi:MULTISPECIES: hypothetical protein [Aneurinibacillus]|jgi:sensor c-di-GMP phosphodiesterase-like protein|uniref:Uncharacterized protein n=1 Tax=Aneurinibacillus danicus TaxID=267746 RepID=A0A511VA07_9BACL|nr:MULTISPECIES: hypothetical protein [Aneurinibacillus]GEN34072.1 hypothetical protein ADA01nite_15320 [Aneurinibacillus danicus]
MGDKRKISTLKGWRKRKQNRLWLRAIQVIGVIAALVLLYNGALSLVRLNTSYLENTLIPSQKLSAVATPEAKAFAVEFSTKWLTAKGINPEIRKYLGPDLSVEKILWPHGERVKQITIKDIAPEGQYKGMITLNAWVAIAGAQKQFAVRLPLQYMPEVKSYQVSGYPELTEINRQ